MSASIFGVLRVIKRDGSDGTSMDLKRKTLTFGRYDRCVHMMCGPSLGHPELVRSAHVALFLWNSALDCDVRVQLTNVQDKHAELAIQDDGKVVAELHSQKYIIQSEVSVYDVYYGLLAAAGAVANRIRHRAQRREDYLGDAANRRCYLSDRWTSVPICIRSLPLCPNADASYRVLMLHLHLCLSCSCTHCLCRCHTNGISA